MDATAWPPNAPYVMQPVSPHDAACPTQNQAAKYCGGAVPEWVLQGAYLAAMPLVDDSQAQSMPLPPQSDAFKYSPENVVLAAGQYREVRPTLADELLGKGGCRFQLRGERLPMGLQLDPASGTIWGSPGAPPPEADPAGPYAPFTVVATGPWGSAAAQVGLKIVDFNPSKFQITHVSQLERNKYMLLLDMRHKGQ
mmetsp:Transcript_63911/g.152436  ORF Transcript_63911/g.152436 Transcript_63911/m.152436 type:complete len:196 (-) Transcript_63911:91-678(-)